MEMTVRSALHRAAQALGAGGLEGARNEAEILAGHLLGCRRNELYSGSDRLLVAGEVAELDRMVAARCTGRPLQYITGVQAFRSLVLKVGPGVLVPRPESEMLVERCLYLIRGLDSPRVVELGTGSGAIALSLATERPDCRVWATEISEDALRWAQANLEQPGTANLELLSGDLFAPLPTSLKGTLSLIVSNPPYLSQEELSRAPRDVREHEPEVALLADDRGMAAVKRIIREGVDWLAPGGCLVVETAGESQWGELRLDLETHYVDVRITPDLAGRDRFIEGRKP